MRRAVANELRDIFRQVPFIVDDDVTSRDRAPRCGSPSITTISSSTRSRSATSTTRSKPTSAALPVGYSHKGGGRHPVEIAVQLPKSSLAITQQTLTTPVPANALPGERSVVELGDVVKLTREEASYPIFRHNGHAAEMVMAELAGAYEAPIYGMLAVDDLVAKKDWGNLPKPEIRFHGQPDDESKPALLWDGEWEVTYVTFRDMGAAFAVALLGIYVLVVAQFGSFKLPLVILTPVPLTLIGIMLGHWLFGAPFTATSMIGFIALAGIIVRNSILLVDFIARAEGERRAAASGSARGRCHPVQAHSVDGACGHDRCSRDPDRSDLPGARDLALVRSRVVNAADGPRHTGDLHRDAGRRQADANYGSAIDAQRLVFLRGPGLRCGPGEGLAPSPVRQGGIDCG